MAHTRLSLIMFDRKDIVSSDYHSEVCVKQHSLKRILTKKERSSIYEKNMKKHGVLIPIAKKLSTKKTKSKQKVKVKPVILGKPPKNVALDYDGKPILSYDGKSYITEEEMKRYELILHWNSIPTARYVPSKEDKALVSKIDGGYGLF